MKTLRTNNMEVIELFVLGYGERYKAVTSHNKNLRIEGNKLVNYGTVLAQLIGNDLIVNTTKYSVTTSKIQTWIKRASKDDYIEVTNVPIYTSDLQNYIPVKN